VKYVYLIQGKADELNLDISLYAIDRKDEFKVMVGFDLGILVSYTQVEHFFVRFVYSTTT
jgi:hypothetical protein